MKASSLADRWTATPAHLASAGTAMAVATMSSFPLLIPHHRYPIPTFYPEWWAVLLGCLALLFAALAARSKPFAIPRIALPPLGLAALIGVQWLLGKSLPAAAGFGLAYLIWASALIVVAANRSVFNGRTPTAIAPSPESPSPLAQALALGLLLGATCGAAAAVAQALGAPPIDHLLSPGGGGQLWGNLQQRNHLAAQMALGVAAAAWLRVELAGQRSARPAPPIDLGAAAPSERTRRPAVPMLVAGAAMLAIAVGVGTGARSFWASLLAMAVVAATMAWRSGDRRSKSLLRVLVAMLALAAICKAIYWSLPTSGDAGNRGLFVAGSDGIRWGLLQTAGELWRNSPLFGVGWGRFPAESFAAGSADAPAIPGEHAHNLIAQLAAETGLAGIALLAIAVLFILRALWRRHSSPDARLALALLASLGAYSLLEYPLWYAFFLAPAALALGLLAQPSTAAGKLPARLLAALALAGLAALLPMRADYAAIERTMRWPLVDPGDEALTWEQVVPRMSELRRHSAFAPWIDYALARALPLGVENPAAALRMIELAMKSFPSDELALQRTILLARQGRIGEASAQWQLIERNFPERLEDLRKILNAAAEQYPEISALPGVDAAPESNPPVDPNRSTTPTSAAAAVKRSPTEPAG